MVHAAANGMQALPDYRNAGLARSASRLADAGAARLRMRALPDFGCDGCGARAQRFPAYGCGRCPTSDAGLARSASRLTDAGAARLRMRGSRAALPGLRMRALPYFGCGQRGDAAKSHDRQKTYRGDAARLRLAVE